MENLSPSASIFPKLPRNSPYFAEKQADSIQTMNPASTTHTIHVDENKPLSAAIAAPTRARC